jgi:hypothetical protein
VLTSIRVGNRQKKIDISIPKLDHFIHKVYINVARKLYTNVYLFEKNISPLTEQKNRREFELIVQECILSTIRESIPTEAIIRAYMDESVEQGGENNDGNLEKVAITEDVKVPVEIAPVTVPTITNLDEEPVMMKLTFNDYDKVADMDTQHVSEVHAPKTIERLERISSERALQRKLEEEQEQEEDRIKIHDSIEDVSLDFDLLEPPTSMTQFPDDISLDIESI